VGAEGVHIMGMVEAFRDLGHVVDLDGLPGCDPFLKAAAPPPAAAGPRPERRGWRHRLYRALSEHAPQSVFGLLELLYNLPLLLRLGRKLFRHKPDLVYERYALRNFAPALLCRLLRIPHVLEVNDSVAIERSRPLSLPRTARFLERRMLGSARLIVTISGQFRAQLLEAFPGLGTPILICPNAVSKNWLREQREPPPHLRDAPELRGRTVLGSAGQFVPWHGLAPFLEAMGPLARERELAFLFIGDGPVRPEVEAMAGRQGIGDRVRFTGMLPYSEVPSCLRRLDIAVIPFSNYHGSPMKLMEFMALGLPVVAPDLPPIREVLKDGITGALFAVGDMDGMRRQLERLLDNRDEAAAMGARARRHVLEHLTWAGHARTVLDAVRPD
jgi:glycosyltransferase involved in cell wall biosynthesis